MVDARARYLDPTILYPIESMLYGGVVTRGLGNYYRKNVPRFPPVSVLFCDIRLRWRAHRIKPTANVDPAVAFPTEVASSRCTDRSGGPFEQGRFCVAASDREPVARAAGDLTHRFRIYIPENELLSLHCLVAHSPGTAFAEEISILKPGQFRWRLDLKHRRPHLIYAQHCNRS